jgi:hypothetical protein
MRFLLFYEELTSRDRKQNDSVGIWKHLGNLQEEKFSIIAILIPYINHPIYFYNKEHCTVLTSSTEEAFHLEFM